MASLLDSIDARTQLAGTNRLELLMFTLGLDANTGRKEIFGINVFKVREVMHAPPITHAPSMPPSVEGFISLRGVLVPVVDLVKFAKVINDKKPGVMIVTEYNGRMQAFLVENVDDILRLNWSDIKAPPAMLESRAGGLITAITDVPGKGLVMVMDVEKILAETCETESEVNTKNIQKFTKSRTVFYADDSSVARKQIEKTLVAMGIDYISAINGVQAWEILTKIASESEAAGTLVKNRINLILTDVEMPEMDGYMLTRKIKSDPRFAGIPVLMHSSLSGVSNQQLGLSVGVDEYVAKFEPQQFAKALERLLA